MDIYNAIIDGPLFWPWLFGSNMPEPANDDDRVYLVKEG